MFKKILLFSLFLLLISCNTTYDDPLYAKYSFDIDKNSGLPYVEGTINKKKALFLIDSGSALTVLNMEDYRYYNISFVPVSNGSSIGVSGKHTSIYPTFFTEVWIDDLLINTNIYVMDLSLFKETTNCDGILGVDFLNKNDMVLDFSSKQIIVKR